MVRYTDQVFGVETSLGMAKSAYERLFGLPAHPLVGDGTSLPFPDKSFDLIFASGVLDLLTDGDSFNLLTETRRVLKPEGRLVTVNMSKLKGDEFIEFSRKFYEWLYYRLPGFLGYYRPLSRPIDVHKILTAAGFKIIFAKLVTPLLFPFPVEITLATP